MTIKFWLISLVAVIASFFGGFLMANAFNRTELNSLKAENERLKSESKDSPSPDTQPSLEDNELKEKIAQADANPTDMAFQKNLGIALSKYASIKQDNGLLKESIRILGRAKQDDADVIVALANAHFDLGYFGKDNAELTTAREFYTKAIAAKPNDAEVHADLGLTFFLFDPPNDETAVAEFQKALKINPKHEKTLEFIIQALARQKRIPEAEKYLTALKTVDPQSETIAPLAAKIEEAKGK